MPTAPDDDEILDLASVYAIGSLDGAAREEFERRLAAGDPALSSAVERMQTAVEQIMIAAPVTPHSRVKERLMAAALQRNVPGFVEPEPGVHVLRADHGHWRETGYPGVSVKVLHIEKETRMATTLLRLTPGARYPSHRHSQLEQCLVISGDVRLSEKIHLRAGDYEKALAGTEHDFLTSDTGCELLIVSCLDDEILMR